MAQVTQAELHGCHRGSFEGCPNIKFCCPACNLAGTQTRKARPEELQRHVRKSHSNSQFMVDNKFDYRTATVEILDPATGAVAQTMTARQYADLINGPSGFAFLTNLNAPTAQHVRSAPGAAGASAPLSAPPAPAAAAAPPTAPLPAVPAAVFVPAVPLLALAAEDENDDDNNDGNDNDSDDDDDDDDDDNDNDNDDDNVETLRCASIIEDLRQAIVSQHMASNVIGSAATNRLLALDLSIDPFLQLPRGQVPHPFQQRCWNGQHQLIAAYTRFFVGQEGLAVITANEILFEVGMQVSILSGAVCVGCLC